MNRRMSVRRRLMVEVESRVDAVSAYFMSLPQTRCDVLSGGTSAYGSTSWIVLPSSLRCIVSQGTQFVAFLCNHFSVADLFYTTVNSKCQPVRGFVVGVTPSIIISHSEQTSSGPAVEDTYIVKKSSCYFSHKFLGQHSSFFGNSRTP